MLTFKLEKPDSFGSHKKRKEKDTRILEGGFQASTTDKGWQAERRDIQVPRQLKEALHRGDAGSDLG